MLLTLKIEKLAIETPRHLAPSPIATSMISIAFALHALHHRFRLDIEVFILTLIVAVAKTSFEVVVTFA